MSEKNWQLALPQDEERFIGMNDRLYTYLYSISKHNPKKAHGEYVEKYNYIYLDKGKNGEPKYSAKDTCNALGFSSATYYRKFDKLISLGLIEKTVSNDRKILKIPFIYSDRILNVKTCLFLSKVKQNQVPPDDIIKTLALLKIWSFGDETFTYSKLKSNLGYSEHKENNVKIESILTTLCGYNLVSLSVESDKVKGCVKQTVYHIDWVSDAPTDIMISFENDRENTCSSKEPDKIPLDICNTQEKSE